MDNENSPTAHTRCIGGPDVGWERWSLPVGNGYFGANVFGRYDSERIQITEKTLQNPPTLHKDGVTYFVGGLNSFSETYIDFGHKNVEGYRRYLDIETAIAGVEYNSEGVHYTREYFASYPHKLLVIRLDADKGGRLSFTLRPTIPYKQSYCGFKGDGVSKRGEVTSYVKNGIGIAELSGSLNYYGIDFIGIYRVYTDGGKTEALTAEHTYVDKDGTEITDLNGVIRVSGAKSAYITVAIATDYELSSDIFTRGENEKPTMLTSLSDAKRKVDTCYEKLDADTAGMSFDEAYEYIRTTHVLDYSELFGRVGLDLGVDLEDTKLTTDALLSKYNAGEHSRYLETLIFQYGRYLLIASSRKGALPANLQGSWNTYNVPPWACGYWHNVNVQMNYWPAFSTNLTETFEAYDDYNAAYMEQAKKHADAVVREHDPEVYGKDGGNGWVIGTDGYQLRITSDRSAGNLGFTTQLFWEYYLYTQDKRVLRRAYELLVDAARYITKCVEEDEDGNYLVSCCDSPEMHVNGVWYKTKGTAYAQSFAYMNNYNALLAARELGIDLEDEELINTPEYSILKTVLSQIDKYDPIIVGLSGQIKEFREEDYYCSIGDEYHHRHTSQILGLYPGNLINETTPAWLDAAKVSLNERGDSGTGWGIALKLNLRARIKDGNRSHLLLSKLINETVMQNLWTLCPPFQIDANFGATAGISEMLLQSHEGYISPLAAIPSDWKNGSFTGLVSRGNFEISAEWEGGLAKLFTLRSRSGGRASVYYPSITGASVTDENGKRVSFTVVDKDLISFDTVIGKSYLISGFRAAIRPEAVKDLLCIKNPGRVKLCWSNSENAVSYNIYKANESSPAYTPIGNVRATEFEYADSGSESGMRKTFAVTAVSEDGTESERALCYRNPRVVTRYGTVPAEYSDMPFALFIKTGENYCYKGSFDTYKEAFTAADESVLISNSSDSALIYMLRNAKFSLNADKARTEPGKRAASITLDLASRTLVLDSTLFEIDTAYEGGLGITVRNGKILTDKGSVVSVYSSGKSSAESDRSIDIFFENVIFGRERYSDETVPIFSLAEGTEKNRLSVNIDLTDCAVDYLSTFETKKVTLFDLAGKCDGGIVNVKIRGGRIELQSFDRLPVFNGSSDSRIIFVKNDKGERTSFRLTDAERPELTFLTDDGEVKLTFVKSHRVHHTLYRHYVL